MKTNNPSVKAKITWRNEDAKSSLKATASITIGNAFQVHGLKVIEGSSGPFVSLPQRQFTDKSGEKKYVNIAHPVTADMKEAVDEAVLNAYSQAVSVAEDASEESDMPESVEDEEDPAQVMSM